MSKKKLEQGLNGLLAATTPQEQAVTPQEQETDVKTKAVCWNLSPNDIENVHRIARYEGKRANAVVTDALRFYFANWKPVPQQAPELL